MIVFELQAQQSADTGSENCWEHQRNKAHLTQHFGLGIYDFLTFEINGQNIKRSGMSGGGIRVESANDCFDRSETYFIGNRIIYRYICTIGWCRTQVDSSILE